MKKLKFKNNIKKLKEKNPDLRLWSDSCALELHKINQKDKKLNKRFKNTDKYE